MKRKMTLLALGAKCGARAAKGLRGLMAGLTGLAARASFRNIADNASAPNPAPLRIRNSRRLDGWRKWLTVRDYGRRAGDDNHSLRLLAGKKARACFAGRRLR